MFKNSLILKFLGNKQLYFLKKNNSTELLICRHMKPLIKILESSMAEKGLINASSLSDSEL